MRIGILGSGQVGQALARGYRQHGYEVRIGSRQPDVAGLLFATPSAASVSTRARHTSRCAAAGDHATFSKAAR